MEKNESKRNIIKKDTALINASYTLTLGEQRLVLLAILESGRNRNELIDSNTELVVHASSYAKHFNVTRQAAYQSLKDAAKSLYNRSLTYIKTHDNGTKERVSRRWVTGSSYSITGTAYVTLIFSDVVVPLISDIERNFTYYDLATIGKLNSVYAIRLYELLIAWRNQRKTPIFLVNELRDKLGVVEGEYIRMEAFKRRVIDDSIKFINEHTDIHVYPYEQFKEGRAIVGFAFKYKFKIKQITEKSAEVTKVIKPMTGKQMAMFASKLSKLPEMSTYAKAGQGDKEFSNWIETELRDVNNIKKWENELKSVDYVISYVLPSTDVESSEIKQCIEQQDITNSACEEIVEDKVIKSDTEKESTDGISSVSEVLNNVVIKQSETGIHTLAALKKGRLKTN